VFFTWLINIVDLTMLSKIDTVSKIIMQDESSNLYALTILQAMCVLKQCCVLNKISHFNPINSIISIKRFQKIVSCIFVSIVANVEVNVSDRIYDPGSTLTKALRFRQEG